MNIKEVKDLIHEILQSDISEFEFEHTGTKVRLRRGPAHPAPQSQSALPSHASGPALPAAIEVSPPPPPQTEEVDETGLHIITSPIVGTFYRAPSPGAEPYVKTGDSVEEGGVLCIVEAMKLMNEIPSDVAGEVVRIFVENGHPIEFGQKLFGIRPHK